MRQKQQIGVFSYTCYNNQIENSSNQFIKAMFNYIDYAQMAPYLCPVQPIFFPNPYFFNFTVTQTSNQGVFYIKNQNVSTENDTPQLESEVSHNPHPKIEVSDDPILFMTLQKQKKITYAENLIKSVTNRNILPNNLNLITSFLRRINKSGKLVRRIIEKHTSSPRYTFKQFYAYQTYLKQNLTILRSKNSLVHLTTHVDPKITCFTVDEQLFYNKVCRILINSYLEDEFLINLLASTKIQKTSKTHHMKVQRYLRLRFKLQASPSHQDILEDNDRI